MKKKKLTEQDFNDIKTVTSVSRLKIRELAKLLGWSGGVVGLVKRSANFAQYQELRQAIYRKTIENKVKATGAKAGRPSNDELVEIDEFDDDLVARKYFKQLISQNNTIITILKAIEYKLDQN